MIYVWHIDWTVDLLLISAEEICLQITDKLAIIGSHYELSITISAICSEINACMYSSVQSTIYVPGYLGVLDVTISYTVIDFVCAKRMK